MAERAGHSEGSPFEIDVTPPKGEDLPYPHSGGTGQGDGRAHPVNGGDLE